MDGYLISDMIYELENATVADVLVNRDDLRKLAKLLTKSLSRRSVKLSIKVRSGADYVYAAYTRGGKDTKVIYVGKHMGQADRANYIADRIAKRDKAKAKVDKLYGVLKTTYSDDVTMNDYRDARAKYDAAKGKLDKLRDELAYAQASLAAVAQCVRPVGLRRLESLEKEGYEIEPLKA